MKELKVGQKVYTDEGYWGAISEIVNDTIVIYNKTEDRYIRFCKGHFENALRYKRIGLRIEENNEELKLELKTKNLNIYEVFTLLEKMPEGTLVKVKDKKMEFKLSKSGDELINTTYDEYIDKFYPLKDLLFLTFDLVEESEEDKRKEQEVSDLEKQIGEIQSKITLLKLGME